MSHGEKRRQRGTVNLSAIQLQSEGIVERVIETLKRVDLNPALLELVITESAAIHDVDNTIRKLQLIRKMSVGIAIDDFGAAYSS